jgi:hypothetical protein
VSQPQAVERELWTAMEAQSDCVPRKSRVMGRITVKQGSTRVLVTKFAPPVFCNSFSEGTGKMNGCWQNQSGQMSKMKINAKTPG